MPRGNKTKVRKDKNGQYRTIVPMAIGDAFNLEGKKLKWEAEGKDKIMLRVVDE